MMFDRGHEIHRRRFSRNLGVGLTLAALIVVIFGLTLVKISEGGMMEGFDHAPRTTLTTEGN